MHTHTQERRSVKQKDNANQRRQWSRVIKRLSPVFASHRWDGWGGGREGWVRVHSTVGTGACIEKERERKRERERERGVEVLTPRGLRNPFLHSNCFREAFGNFAPVIRSRAKRQWLCTCARFGRWAVGGEGGGGRHVEKRGHAKGVRRSVIVKGVLEAWQQLEN